MKNEEKVKEIIHDSFNMYLKLNSKDFKFDTAELCGIMGEDRKIFAKKLNKVLEQHLVKESHFDLMQVLKDADEESSNTNEFLALAFTAFIIYGQKKSENAFTTALNNIIGLTPQPEARLMFAALIADMGSNDFFPTPKLPLSMIDDLTTSFTERAKEALNHKDMSEEEKKTFDAFIKSFDNADPMKEMRKMLAKRKKAAQQMEEERSEEEQDIEKLMQKAREIIAKVDEGGK